MLVYCNQWTPLPVVKSCDKSFLHRCKSQSCSIFISATPSINSPSCSIIAQYLGLAGPPKWLTKYMDLLQPDPPLEVTERCDMGLSHLYISMLSHHYWCNSLSVLVQIAAYYFNIWLSYGGNMTRCIC